MIYYNILYYSYFGSGLLLGDVKMQNTKVIFNPHSLQCKYKMEMRKKRANSKRDQGVVVENSCSPPITLMIFLQSLREESYENLETKHRVALSISVGEAVWQKTTMFSR